MRFVWFWTPAADQGIELKLSMESVRRNFTGPYEFTVIGTRPSWYDGHFIPTRRPDHVIGDEYGTSPFRDTQHKIIVAATHPEIPEEFCWIADDVFFKEPVTEDDLKVPRFDPWYRVNGSVRVWHVLIRRTFDALRDQGYPMLQYGTHLPHVFEKSKLLQVFREFDYPRRMLLFEILYGNRWHENAQCYSPFLKRMIQWRRGDDLDAAFSGAKVINYTSQCWSGELKEWLIETFDPDRSADSQKAVVAKARQ